MYVTWKLPRMNKIKHLANVLLSKRFKTMFVIIVLQHIGDGNLVMAPEPLQFFSIANYQNDDDTSIYTQAYLNTIRSNIAKHQYADIFPDIKNHNEAMLVFQIYDIVKPLSELIHFVSTIEVSKTTKSIDDITPTDFMALIEDINTTS